MANRAASVLGTALAPIGNALVRAAEGVVKGFYGGGPAAWTEQGMIPFSWPINFWQTGRDPYASSGPNAAVEACVSAISQSVAMMPVAHWRQLKNGGREEVLTSPAHRVLRRPNAYQTRAEFVVNLLRNVLFRGNGYALALIDNRFQIYELHLVPPGSVGSMIDPETGEIFYQIGGNPVLDGVNQGLEIDPRRMVPLRNVLHLRLHSTRNPLQGETPLTAAYTAIAAGNAIAGHNATFFQNMSRPSGVLSTDKDLAAATVAILRDAWNNATTGGETGGTPVLTHGLKWITTSMTAEDAALIESYKLTISDIARVFRVPPPIIGDTSQTYANTETLIRHWISTGLGYVIEQTEASLDDLFKLPDGEYIEFDTDYLLRSEFLARIDGLTKGITGGLFAPNEARAREGLPAVKGGDTVYVQQQLQRIEDRADNIALDAGTPKAAPIAPTPTPDPNAPPPPEPPAPPKKAAKVEYKRRIRELI